jgi:UPF0755 protein
MTAKKKKKVNRWPWVILAIVVLVLGAGAYLVFGPNSKKERYLYIHTGTTYAQLLATLRDSGYVRDITSFGLLASQAGLKEHVKPGKYAVKRWMSNYELVRMLRNGRQTPVKLVINKVRTINELVTLMSNNLEASRDSLSQLFRDTAYLSDFDLDTSTLLCAIIPDTYDFYWNTSADKAFKKIQKNYNRFWTTERKKLAKAHDLTPTQATIVASIVEEETNRAEDKPNIASVYLNRIKKGMKLQADPTVKYAVGDFTIHRVSGAMLKNSSPYNTYQHEGLPPGPICTPMPSTVDAVLNSPATTYIFFCAKADLGGGSVFATTDEEHLKNARAYQKALDARGIH